jgi:hypothetical protein
MNNQCPCLDRRFVNGILASITAWPFGVIPLLSSEQANGQYSFRYLLLSLFGDLKSASAIGSACLNYLPTSTAEQLANEILAIASCDAEAMKNREALRRQIINRVRGDFAKGAIISVDGWLLSLTEARVYALVTLSLGSQLPARTGSSN